MDILFTKRNLDIMPKPNEYHLILDKELPPRELITAALGLIFDGDRFLMTKLNKRGWDIPGRHLEPGEAPNVAAQRDIYEETAVHDSVGGCHVELTAKLTTILLQHIALQLCTANYACHCAIIVDDEFKRNRHLHTYALPLFWPVGLFTEHVTLPQPQLAVMWLQHIADSSHRYRQTIAS